MYLWRKRATAKWWIDNETPLRVRAGLKLAVIERSDRKRLQIEVAAQSQHQLRALAKEFGGRVTKLPSDWLKRALHSGKTKPIKIGNYKLLIPASVAFGTGEHATTALSLRMLERLTRNWKSGWSIVDLGTGSGILALAAKRLGAGRATGVDIDPIAISTAKVNARLNKIDDVKFQVADVRRWESPTKVDVITANLFSELLIEIVQGLKGGRWLVLSGILRNQENEMVRALKRNKIGIMDLRRRGKWIAILAEP
jgi:ribosomal protein L11 methyltransferase